MCLVAIVYVRTLSLRGFSHGRFSIATRLVSLDWPFSHSRLAQWSLEDFRTDCQLVICCGKKTVIQGLDRTRLTSPYFLVGYHSQNKELSLQYYGQSQSRSIFDLWFSSLTFVEIFDCWPGSIYFYFCALFICEAVTVLVKQYTECGNSYVYRIFIHIYQLGTGVDLFSKLENDYQHKPV